MGGLVGILSTVILVSTLATLVFAVFAYAASRKRQTPTEETHHDYAIPVEAAPSLPSEFLLRINDVQHGKPSEPAAPPPQETKKSSVERPSAPPAAAPLAPPPNPERSAVGAHTPLFTSLADKKKRAQPPAPAPDPYPAPAPDPAPVADVPEPPESDHTPKPLFRSLADKKKNLPS